MIPEEGEDEHREIKKLFADLLEILKAAHKPIELLSIQIEKNWTLFHLLCRLSLCRQRFVFENLQRILKIAKLAAAKREIAKLLFIRDKDGFTPLHFACMHQTVETLGLLLSVLAERAPEAILMPLPPLMGGSVLHLAAGRQDAQRLESLLQLFPRNDDALTAAMLQDNEDGLNALQLSCIEGHPQNVDLLATYLSDKAFGAFHRYVNYAGQGYKHTYELICRAGHATPKVFRKYFSEFFVKLDAIQEQHPTYSLRRAINTAFPHIGGMGVFENNASVIPPTQDPHPPQSFSQQPGHSMSGFLNLE